MHDEHDKKPIYEAEKNHNSAEKLPTLAGVLRRIHLSVAIVSVVTACIFLTVAALFALRVYVDHNLHLIARAISYTTEAAVVLVITWRLTSYWR